MGRHKGGGCKRDYKLDGHFFFQIVAFEKRVTAPDASIHSNVVSAKQVLQVSGLLQEPAKHV